MNKLLEKIITARNGHYCHAFEGNLETFQNFIDDVFDEFSDEFSIETITEFLQTLELYYYNPDNENSEDENALYNFSIKNYIKENYYF